MCAFFGNFLVDIEEIIKECDQFEGLDSWDIEDLEGGSGEKGLHIGEARRRTSAGVSSNDCVLSGGENVLATSCSCDVTDEHVFTT